jgi:hypothetical protein
MIATVIRTESGASIARAIDDIFLQEGPCRVLVTDNGKALIGAEVAGLLRDYMVEHKRIPRYSGFSGGWYERQHATLVRILASISIASNTWARYLKLALLYANLRPYEGSVEIVGRVMSPFEVFRGRMRPRILESNIAVDNPVPSDEQVGNGLSTIQREMAVVRENFEGIWKANRQVSFNCMAEKQQREARVEVGDMVYVWIPKLLQDKIGARWEGPYLIEDRVTKEGTIWKVNGKQEHAYNLKKAVGTQR